MGPSKGSEGSTGILPVRWGSGLRIQIPEKENSMRKAVEVEGSSTKLQKSY